MAPVTIYLKDNSLKSLDLENFPPALKALSGKKISEFENLLSLSADDIEDLSLFNLTENTIQTNNLMGFIGTPDGNLVITSRFCPDTAGNSPQNDFFLYYVLSKTLNMNLNWLKSFSFHSGITAWLQLLPLLFPDYLNRACAQGIYKQYMSVSHNDACIKGRIDVARHIKYNIPFQGKICYTQRQYSFDNPLTQLIRHTVEYIRTTPWGNNLLSNTIQTQQNIRLITQATPSYSPAQRTKIIRQNLRPITSPYFSNYVPLQKLCLRILRQEPISYGTNDSKIYGIVFDGAWLWESYLNTLLQPLGFEHPDNKKDFLPYPLFTDGSYNRYVDFRKKDKDGKWEMVLDAKYKDLPRKGTYSKGDTMRNDLHQLITYMHIFASPRGVLACPTKESTATGELLGKLQGLGGDIWIERLVVPQANGKTYADFCKEIKNNENTFCLHLQKYLQTDILPR